MSATADDSNVGIAFACVVGASLATGLGASVVFFPALVKLADHRVLAASLGFSAGVMGFVSFLEIFPKSQMNFEESGYNTNQSFNLATLFFFVGVATMFVLNFIVHKMVGSDHHQSSDNEVVASGKSSKNEDTTELAHRVNTENDTSTHEEYLNATSLSACNSTSDWAFMCLPGCSDDLDFYKHVVSTIDNKPAPEEDKIPTRNDEESPSQQGTHDISDFGSSDRAHESDVSLSDKYNERKLLHMGLLTAIAIGLHNFPEGLATFVAVLDNPKIGGVLAVAIAVHNVPEGLCVAIPVYYATGNRRKAFLWGMLSGMTELIAAFFGWVVLSNSYSTKMFGILFGLVSGMMISICVRELIPTAHRHDPQDKIVTKSFVSGMLIMGISLVLFRI